MATIGEKSRIWDSETPALGAYFEEEFSQLYDNDEELNDKKFEKSGGEINGDVVIKGNLSVEGVSAEIEVEHYSVKDKVITLNKGEIGPGVTGDGLSGIEIDRGDGQEKASIVWNENIKDFQFGLEGKLARRAEPIGSLKFICNAYFSNASNGSKTLFNFDMPYGYCLADGRAPNDPDSEIFNTENRHVPNISDDRFLMGATEAGNVGGASSVTLSHSLSTYSKTIAFDFDHNHNIGSHSHSQGDLIALVRPFVNDSGITGERIGVARVAAGSFTPNYAFFLDTETENTATVKSDSVEVKVRPSGSLQIAYLDCNGTILFNETSTVSSSDVTGDTGSTSPSCSTTSGLDYSTNVNHNHTTEDHTVSLLPVFLSILVLYKYKN